MISESLQFHHLGVAVADLGRAIEDYRALLGYELASGPFEDPIQKVTVCFLSRAGQPQIELIAPLTPDSPIKRLLSAGGGAYHLCYSVANIEKTVADARAAQCLLISGPAPAVAFGGRRIAWFYTPSRQLVEVVERE